MSKSTGVSTAVPKNSRLIHSGAITSSLTNTFMATTALVLERVIKPAGQVPSLGLFGYSARLTLSNWLRVVSSDHAKGWRSRADRALERELLSFIRLAEGPSYRI